MISKVKKVNISHNSPLADRGKKQHYEKYLFSKQLF
jgi:hypothetical protein